MFEAALGNAKQGWYVFPISGKTPLMPSAHPEGDPMRGKCKGECGAEGHGFYDATTDEAKITAWWRQHPQAGIGIACGVSGLAVVDVDPRNGGAETLAELEREHGPLPRTPKSLTGGGGQHYYFAAPKGVKLPAHLGPGIDLKGDGGYVVAPPSMHPSGKAYEWDAGAHLKDIPLAPLPKWIAQHSAPTTITTATTDEIRAGGRNMTLTSLAGTMCRRGMGAEAIEAALLAHNERVCKPPLSPEEVHRIAVSVAHYQSTQKGAHVADSRPDMTQNPLHLIRLSDVAAEDVQWLWHPYIPLGKVTLLEGDPGVGKSHVALAVATAVTLGRGLPGQGVFAPGNVLVLSAEDGLGDTIRPRLDKIGANVSRVTALDETVTFDDAGLTRLEAAIVQTGAILVIVDPIVAYMGAQVDLHRANETRAVLARLAAIAERHGCAILAIRHLSKSQQGRAIYRGLGSIDITAAARSVLLAGCDSQAPLTRALAHIKSNLAAQGEAVGYEITPDGFHWTGRSELTADRMLAPDGESSPRSEVQEAETFLRELLANGLVPVKDVGAEAKNAGIAWRTIERAKTTLGVTSKRDGETGQRGGGQWSWGLRPPRAPVEDFGGVNAKPYLNETGEPSSLGGLNSVRNGRSSVTPDGSVHRHEFLYARCKEHGGQIHTVCACGLCEHDFHAQKRRAP